MNNQTEHPQVLGFAAFSGTGKTTLLTRLIPLLTDRGLRLAVIKLSHHNFSIDQPGKDSHELHKAGARQTLLTSRYRSALISENATHEDPTLVSALRQLDLASIDLVLVEGFRHQPNLYKIELHRRALDRPLLFPDDDHVIALCSDETLATALPVLDIDDVRQIADFVSERWQQKALSFPLASDR